jgi:GNAT superfamily N-acetyltransferase
MVINIEIGNVADIATLSKEIPEFEQATTPTRLNSKLNGVVKLILVAKVDAVPVGFKVGYQLTEYTFYSWLGGVVPEYRKSGIATLLLNYQEQWARQSGYKRIKVKSMHRFPGMLNLLISNGYKSEGVEDNADGSEIKIVFSKNLSL